MSFIKSELETREYEVRNITNVLHKMKKYPFPLFFVDLEPSLHSNDLYKLTSLLHTKFKVKEPYKVKSINQCINCYEYGHTKTYCGYPSHCVRCGEFHQSSACPNPKNAPLKYTLCHGNHPAN